ncbi:MAG: tRNA (guanosine(46)-N7)-methyltransferase TrmB [Bacteroidales bacterium]|jgi:tRNA (guanine-N7-)-methyltransferase|nr:tRNA (guanosine(46)-N7)-methyltransferase TrmB [Bacteroidales bacterium]MDD2263468.1 tRNA (guanosine(46)-N7)-methyltransferase TrmB [Bacteroidales bacterium]MDD2830742.1 tRNA (guanosine(46)-N7)-methyltransferase TrmB [Bacteroidales bacterium]MDD3207941.1 tRNA (guanosine(46)-N7)-methyltransferase TrmB [Bacteroidales bacterium]MDD3696552.1 tRNA (guanosine(46)-N7)-methyltransferase TrmB [Bacteroidales bacterium]
MGKDKLRRFKENKGFPNLYESSFEEVYGKDHPLKGRWAKEVFGNDNLVILELGCGKGEYTLALARGDKQHNYIGIDIKGARLWRGAKTALEEKIENAAFIRTRIEFIDSFFAPGEISEIWITFPDPQPRKENRRLTSPRFLNCYLKFLTPGAVIHLKTDNRPLYDYTRQVVEKWQGLQLLDADTDIYNSRRPDRDPAVAVRTFYERLFLEEGKPITYLKFSTGNLSTENRVSP